MVKFDSDVGSFSTFDDVAQAFLELLGHSGSVPGAIAAQDVGASLARVRARVAALPPASPPSDEDDEHDDRGADKVPLARRAVALIELLEGAEKHASGIRWNRA